MFKKLLPLLLLSLNAQADSPSTFDPKTMTAHIPRMYVEGNDTGFLQNISLKFDDTFTCTIDHVESVPSESGLNSIEYSVTTKINNFVGLQAESIFYTSSGITFRVLSYEKNSVESLESDPSVIINKMKDGNFVLTLFNTSLAVEPYVYRSILYTSLDQFVGVRNKTTFMADGRLWQSQTVIPFSAGVNITIYDQKYMVLNGYTFKVKILG